jgi:hypothetical protein
MCGRYIYATQSARCFIQTAKGPLSWRRVRARWVSFLSGYPATISGRITTWGETNATSDFCHYPQERWFKLDGEWDWPQGLLTPELVDLYNHQHEIDPETLVDLNSGNLDRGICAIPYRRQTDGGNGLLSDQCHCESLCEQRDGCRKLGGRSANAGAFRNRRALRQVPRHPRLPVLAKRSGRRHSALSENRSRPGKFARGRLRHSRS